MEKSKIENKLLKIGNTSFNKESLKGLTESDFKKAYKGKINVDLKEAWREVRKFTKK